MDSSGKDIPRVWGLGFGVWGLLFVGKIYKLRKIAKPEVYCVNFHLEIAQKVIQGPVGAKVWNSYHKTRLKRNVACKILTCDLAWQTHAKSSEA